MALPPSDTPLYNHPLPDIEQWLVNHGCQQDSRDRHFWQIKTDTWKAEISLDVDSLKVRYLNAGDDGSDIQRSFKYSLSRQDLEEAVFSGP
ncbi:MAG: DUF3143 domain-containing protein [Leptolyngbyaceae bacterium]|jgi:hypothetical protein|nr:DUF3143 domain-containing protein [Leptolyngbyaceae bacterium]